MGFGEITDEQGTAQLQEFLKEWGDKPFTATDLLAWQDRQERFGLRLVTREEKVPTIITVNEEGQAMMDVRFWMDYARRSNRYYNALRQISALDGETPLSPHTEIAREALKE